MYNLHCHSLLSDGDLLASELAVRFQALGYKAIAITDHADYSNIDTLINSIMQFSRHWPKNSKLKVLPGIELTHLPLEQYKPLAKYAREQGIKIIIGHGETLAEPVIKGTNRACLEARGWIPPNRNWHQQIRRNLPRKQPHNKKTIHQPNRHKLCSIIRIH